MTPDEVAAAENLDGTHGPHHATDEGIELRPANVQEDHDHRMLLRIDVCLWMAAYVVMATGLNGSSVMTVRVSSEQRDKLEAWLQHEWPKRTT